MCTNCFIYSITSSFCVVYFLSMESKMQKLDLSSYLLGSLEVLDYLESGGLVNEIEMIKIPKGKFKMGSPLNESRRYSDENQVNVVITKDFEIGKYSITQKQWSEIMGKNPSYNKRSENNPVENISWYDTQEFIDKLNLKTGLKYRLPTEAEWEYACRAGTVTPSHFSPGEADEYLWNFQNSGGMTHPVGEKKPNRFGVYDMHGNVWEWLYDAYQDDLPGGTDPVVSAGSYRVVRGGSYNYYAESLRSAFRNFFSAGDSYGNIGFRLARSL